MARISKADHAKILHDVDVGNRKVAEVAVDYGCTPANIYALLNRLRRVAGAEEPVVEVAGPELAAPEPATPEPAGREPVAPELVALSELVVMPEAAVAPAPKKRAKTALPVVAEPTSVVDLFAAEPVAEPVVALAPLPASPPVSATVTPLSRRGGVGAGLAKAGFGLAMRTADGDESMTPFRSLEDLLSSAKQILRSVARNPDPVWFSIQSVDLAAIDLDVA